jgi:hypothetical protein
MNFGNLKISPPKIIFVVGVKKFTILKQFLKVYQKKYNKFKYTLIILKF